MERSLSSGETTLYFERAAARPWLGIQLQRDRLQLSS